MPWQQRSRSTPTRCRKLQSSPVQRVLWGIRCPPEEEHYLISKDEIESELVILLAGRAAEELVFNTKTTGAANDIERASELARNMITQYGMSDKFGMIALESLQNKYLDGRSVSNCSEETQTQIDNEVIALLKTSYEKAQSLLRDNMDALKGISEYLIEKETITGKQFMEIFNQYQEQPKLEAAPETSEE